MRSFALDMFIFTLTISANQSVAGDRDILQGTLLNTSFPSPLIGHSVVYDGMDSIYIFGGVNKENTSQVLRFNITTSTINEIGKQPGFAVRGQLQICRNGNIFHFGGGINEIHFYEFSSKDKSCDNGPTYWKHTFSSSVKHVSSEVVLFAETAHSWGYLITYDLQTNKYMHQQAAESTKHRFGAAGVKIGNKDFAFTSSNARYESLLWWNFDVEKTLNTGVPKQGWVDFVSTDKKYIYIIGGSAFDMNALLKLDTVSSQYSLIEVERVTVGYPKVFYFYPAAVVVEKLNRIYFFNGISDNSEISSLRNEIGYIQLNKIDKVTSLRDSTLMYPDESLGLATEDPVTKISTVNPQKTTARPIESAKTNSSYKTEEQENSVVGENNGKPDDLISGNTSGTFEYQFWFTLVFIPVLILAVAFQTFRVIQRRSRPKAQGVYNEDNLETISPNEEQSLPSETHSTPDKSRSGPTKNLVWKSRQPLQLDSTEAIGGGGFGKVYKARHSLHSNMHFAIKKIEMFNALQQLDWDIEKVLREVENLSKILNPNVVRLWNCWIEDQEGELVCEDAREKLRFHEFNSTTKDYSMFLQMEFCDSTLKDWLAENDSLEERINKNVKRIMTQLVNGMRGVHRLEIIHRDINPGNIFHCFDGNVWKIGDLGLSKGTSDIGNENSENTVAGWKLYGSPESNTDAESNTVSSKHNPKTDVFSLGLCFLEIVCIFKSQSMKTSIFQQIRKGGEKITLTSTVKIDPVVELNITELLSKMLAKNPTDRIDIFNSLFDKLLS